VTDNFWVLLDCILLLGSQVRIYQVGQSNLRGGSRKAYVYKGAVIVGL
jgi:hypothetical protein